MLCFLAMTTLADLERAIDALPREQKQTLLGWLSENLAEGKRNAGEFNGWPVPPPDVPIEELRRIHALIEAEFPILEEEPRNGASASVSESAGR